MAPVAIPPPPPGFEFEEVTIWGGCELERSCARGFEEEDPDVSPSTGCDDDEDAVTSLLVSCELEEISVAGVSGEEIGSADEESDEGD